MPLRRAVARQRSWPWPGVARYSFAAFAGTRLAESGRAAGGFRSQSFARQRLVQPLGPATARATGDGSHSIGGPGHLSHPAKKRPPFARVNSKAVDSLHRAARIEFAPPEWLFHSSASRLPGRPAGPAASGGLALVALAAAASIRCLSFAPIERPTRD